MGVYFFYFFLGCVLSFVTALQMEPIVDDEGGVTKTINCLPMFFVSFFVSVQIIPEMLTPFRMSL